MLLTHITSLYGDVFPESYATQGLENVFSWKSIAVSQITYSYDDCWIENFDSNIEFREGNYIVALLWHLETLWDIPSNFTL